MTAAADRPAFLRVLAAALPDALPDDLAQFAPPAGAATRAAAVLVLLGPGADGRGDVVLLERAAGLRAHPGQVAFPGGAVDAADGGDPVVAALREAREETGLSPAGVDVLGVLPALHVARSGFLVTPVLAWQVRPQPLAAADPREVARVLRVPLPALVDPRARVTVRHPSGWRGPAFDVDDVLVWGFTAGLLGAVLRLAGLERPWDAARELALPERWAGVPGTPPSGPVVPR
ncbi:CoA pyrophosphatase [Quadrisphaera sp. DSM 44207]|uniref:NUDIX hydrolase n=1 Tax=Quadrisphaera sp. DSM 44207 TaxID=1881057 RepID=UPI00088198E5|nr:CoA pyrophosphatase [Quadrisphaera sp. DSM 44207]SDQ17971.1 ADP-ribose pyrophosphatase YjhB, NUDIX family [Quadrisphaera sp. DSM 44207]